MEEHAEQEVTLKDAAEELGISLKSLRQRIKYREIPVRKVPGKFGLYTVILREDLGKLGDAREQGCPQGMPARIPADPPAGMPSFELLERALLIAERAQQERLGMAERALFLERQAVRQEMQLQQYQRVLTEQSEVLAQTKVESQAKGYQQAEESLREENLRQQERWAMEMTELKNELALKSRRVDWLEKRLPRWVRRVFGAV